MEDIVEDFCVVAEFHLEANKVAIGYVAWLPEEFRSILALKKAIDAKQIIPIKWPMNIKVESPMKMKRALKKTTVKFMTTTAIIRDEGSKNFFIY